MSLSIQFFSLSLVKLFSDLSLIKTNEKLHKKKNFKLNYKPKPNLYSLMVWYSLPSAYDGIYRRNGKGRARLNMRPNRWPNRKDFLIRLEIRLEIWTKLLANRKDLLIRLVIRLEINICLSLDLKLDCVLSL